MAEGKSRQEGQVLFAKVEIQFFWILSCRLPFKEKVFEQFVLWRMPVKSSIRTVGKPKTESMQIRQPVRGSQGFIRNIYD